MNITKTGVCHIPVEMSGDYGLELTAEIIARYTYQPGYAGDRIDPPEPPHVEIESAILKINDKVVSGVGLDELDEESIEEACFEHATAN